MPSEEEIRLSYLKCYKRWMIHIGENKFAGWWITMNTDILAAGW